ncbi:MAG: HdeD family acid-resistance protein [Huintestinicola sp.]
MKALKRLKWFCLGISIVLLLLGLYLIIWPYISAIALCYLLSAILFVSGVVRIYCYGKYSLNDLFHYYELPLGILDVLMGVYGFVHSRNVIIALPVIIGVLILIDSAFQIQTSIYVKRMGFQSWIGIFLLSVTNIIFASMLILNPFAGARTLMLFIGLSLTVESVQIIALIICASGHIREAQMSESIDLKHKEL